MNREPGTQNEPIDIQGLRESAGHLEFPVRIPVFHVPSSSAPSTLQFNRKAALASIRMRTRPLTLALVTAAIAFVTLPWVAEASDPFLVVPSAVVVDSSPAYRYANMEAQAAIDELDRRGILYQRVEPHGDVRTPIRLTGRLHGVHIHSSLPEHERPTTPFEICDARFALALDDFAALLARRDIVELVHYTMYRPAVASAPAAQAHRGPWMDRTSKLGPPDRWDMMAKTTAKAGKRPAPASPRKTNKTTKPSRTKPGKSTRTTKPTKTVSPPTPRLVTTVSRHPLGLAIDPGVFIKRDGTVLSVASHFHGKIGAQTCGRGVSVPKDPRAQELWAIVCETFDEKIFTYVLTPNFDQPHQDHFHMDINPGVRWFLYH